MRLATAAVLLAACSGGGKATTPQAPGDAAHTSPAPFDAAAPRRAHFDRSKLSPDVEPCVGHDGEYVHCLARVVTGNRPKSLAFSPDGKELWVALHYDKPALAIYDTTSFKLIGAVELGKYGAVELAFSADGTRVYASQFETADVYEVNRARRKLLRVLETGSEESKVIELSPDGKTLWVANWSGNEVTEFDLASGKRRRGLETPGIPRGLYATHDGKELWVAGFEPGRLWRFDLDTGARATIFDKGHSMRHLVADEDDERLYISDLGDAKVYVADMLTGDTKVLAEVDPKPNTIDLTPDGKVLFVSCRGTNNPETYLNVGPEWGTVLAIDAHSGRKLDAMVTGNQFNRSRRLARRSPAGDQRLPRQPDQRLRAAAQPQAAGRQRRRVQELPGQRDQEGRLGPQDGPRPALLGSPAVSAGAGERRSQGREEVARRWRHHRRPSRSRRNRAAGCRSGGSAPDRSRG